MINNIRAVGIAAALLAAAVSTSATATVTVNPSGSVTVGGAAGGNFTINYDGYGGAPAVMPGLTSAITFGYAGTSNGGLTYNFTYNVTNNSSAPITGSRVSGFGFNVDPNISGASATGVIANFNGSGNIPNLGSVEACFVSGSSNSCAGGGNGGVQQGTSAGGTFALNFSSTPAAGTITLSNFYDRYQSISGAGNVTSAIGRPVNPVPEPATWAMMLLGFGAVGYSMRRRLPPVLAAAV